MDGLSWVIRTAQRFIRVADQQTFRLLVMLQHHLVGFTPDARLLITPKRRVRRIGVIAVSPYAPGLNAPSHFIGQITVAAPDARPQAIWRVVGNLQRLLHRFEGGHGQHRSENFLLENAHVVLTKQDRRLKVVPFLQIAHQHLTATAGQNIRPSFLPISM